MPSLYDPDSVSYDQAPDNAPDHRYGWGRFPRVSSEPVTPKVLRVNRQFYEEASPVYYSQPFVFSGHLAWIGLYHRLSQIGPRNRLLVRTVTSVHPIFCFQPSEDYDRDVIHREHFQHLGFDNHLKYCTFTNTGPDWDPHQLTEMVPDPSYLLWDLTGLRSVRLTYPSYESRIMNRPWFWESAAQYSVHSMDPVGNQLQLIIEKKPWEMDWELSENLRDEVRSAESRFWEAVEAGGWWKIVELTKKSGKWKSNIFPQTSAQCRNQCMAPKMAIWPHKPVSKICRTQPCRK
jgi:hypothetical protein